MMAASNDGRGRYDRGSTPSERARHAREAILDATRRALLDGTEEPSVADICGLTGLGRNTFYGHFESSHEPVRQVVDESITQIESALLEATLLESTPYAAATEFSEGWFRVVRSEPDAVRIAARCGADRFEAALRARLVALYESGARAGVYRRVLDPERVTALTGLVRALSLDVAAGTARAEASAAALHDALLGLLR